MKNDERHEIPRDSDGDTAAIIWAKGGMWMLILLGLGGCFMMANKHGDQPLIRITTEAPSR